MTKRQKTWLRNGVRLGVCALAVWIVSRSITLSDRVMLRDPPGGALEGRVTAEAEDFVELELADGSTRRIDATNIARGEDDERRISYGLITAWNESRGGFLLLSLGVFLGVPFLQAARIKWLLAAQDIPIGLWESIKVTFAGNFLNFAAPLGATGGDVFKAYYFSLHTTHKTEAVTSVFLDRIIGLGSLVLVVAVFALLAPADSALSDFRAFTLGFLALAVVGVLAYPSPRLRAWFLRPRLVARIPMGDQIRRIDRTARALLAKPVVLLGAVGYTILLQGVAMASYCVVAVAMNMAITFPDVPEYYAYYATGAIVQALPGPPQGLGTVELVYSFFFKPFGSPSQIVCMALAIRVIALVASMPGLLVTLTGAYKPPDEAALHETELLSSDADERLPERKATVSGGTDPAALSAHSSTR